MKRIATMGVLALAVLAGGCEVTVNNKSIDNQVDAAADRAGAIADSAGNIAESAGEAIGNQADALGNRLDRLDNKVDIHVDIGGNDSASNGH